MRKGRRVPSGRRTGRLGGTRARAAACGRTAQRRGSQARSVSLRLSGWAQLTSREDWARPAANGSDLVFVFGGSDFE